MRHPIRVFGCAAALCLGAQPASVSAQPAIVVEEQVHTFGAALEPIAGLGDDIVVLNPSGPTSGAARVYDGTTGALVRTIPGGDGQSVATSGPKVLVGPSITAPAVRLFDGTTGMLLQSFAPPPTTGGYTFGDSVAFLGADVLVGDPGDNSAAPRAGAVHLYDATTGALLRTFVSPAPVTDETFGASVAALGGNVLVGAPSDVGSPPGPGAVYLFDAAGALLRTFAPPPQVTEDFGVAVAALGANVLVGAPGEAYLFDPGTGALLLTFSTPGASGRSLATVGANVLVGATHQTTTQQKAFLLDGTTATLLHTFTNPGLFTPIPSDPLFGYGVAAAGPNALVSDPVADVTYLYCGGAAGCAPCETCGPGGRAWRRHIRPAGSSRHRLAPERASGSGT